MSKAIFNKTQTKIMNNKYDIQIIDNALYVLLQETKKKCEQHHIDYDIENEILILLDTSDNAWNLALQKMNLLDENKKLMTSMTRHKYN